MIQKKNNPRNYIAHFASQVPVIGKAGQRKLRLSRIHISGTGRIGTWIALSLAAAGVGYLSANDPQKLEDENVGNLVFARSSDKGSEKVTVLDRLFRADPDVTFIPVAAKTESGEVDQYIETADVVVSCANQLEARLYAERKAIASGKPVIQVAAYDGRNRLGGLMTVHLPQRELACFGCYCKGNFNLPRGKGLLSTVTTTLAALASHMIVQLIAFNLSPLLLHRNLFFIDLETYSVEPLAIQKRKGCRICGPHGRK